MDTLDLLVYFGRNGAMVNKRLLSKIWTSRSVTEWAMQMEAEQQSKDVAQLHFGCWLARASCENWN